MKFGSKPILVVGDAMLDHYICGEVKRISPEAPVPVVSKSGAWSVPGGAANVARNLARLGCRARLLGLAGSDAAGDTLRQQLAAEGVETALIRSCRQTTAKTRVLAHGQQLLRLDEETARCPDNEENNALQKQLHDLLPGSAAVILSDYAKGVFLNTRQGENFASYVIALARERQIPVFVDPKGTDWGKYAGAACITPNANEFLKICESLGIWQCEKGEPSSQQRRELAEHVRKQFQFENLLLTRGGRGMTFYSSRNDPIYIRAITREVADVSGAGDTVIATLAACAAEGMSWVDAARIANTAAGVAVTKLGAAPVSIAELNNALNRNEPVPKLCAWPELELKLRMWREADQRIVFTNGCFDILHPGHISLLRQSASFGDRLVVGLNSDASVKRLKGQARPIQHEQSRALLLAALESVDAVILFDEDTPENLVRLIRPDTLVKGSDYKVEDIAGAAFVQSYGGQIRLVDLVAGFSTTDIARRIQEQK